MIELTLGAQQRLSSYIDELRRVLVDDGKTDPHDVERDVRDHIQTVLANASGPIDEPQLDQVLRTLGAPAEWIEQPDRPWYAQSPKVWLNSTKQTVSETVQHLATGPESYRLPYLSLLTLVLGLMLTFFTNHFNSGLAIFVVTALGAFVLARAAIATQPQDNLSQGQTWLLSPALLVVYLPLLIAVVSWPVVVSGTLISQTPLLKFHTAQMRLELQTAGVPMTHPDGRWKAERSLANTQAQVSELQKEQTDLLSQLGFPILLCMFWWLVLGILSLSLPNAIRAMFAPFSPRTVRWGMVGIAVLSVLITGPILWVWG